MPKKPVNFRTFRHFPPAVFFDILEMYWGSVRRAFFCGPKKKPGLLRDRRLTSARYTL
jgi:hypothetical protein